MSEVESIFLSTCDDILAKARSKKKYDVIRASGLLRHLILDGNSLVEQVNREYQIKIRYEVLVHQKIKLEYFDEPSGTVQLYWRNLDPSIAYLPTRWITVGAHNAEEFFFRSDFYSDVDEPPVHIKTWYDAQSGMAEEDVLTHSFLADLLRRGQPLPTKKLRLKAFLTQECLLINGNRYNVKKIIRTTALMRGGVHSRRPESADERLILDFDNAMKVSGIDASLLILAGLCNVVVTGLKPLIDAVLD